MLVFVNQKNLFCVNKSIFADISIQHSKKTVSGQRVDLGGLTGLAEYRNGGMLLETGAISFRSDLPAEPLSPADGRIVEWRALTVSALDEIGQRVPSFLPARRQGLGLGELLEAGQNATALLEPTDALLDDMPLLVLRLVESPVPTAAALLVRFLSDYPLDSAHSEPVADPLEAVAFVPSQRVRPFSRLATASDWRATARDSVHLTPPGP